MELASLKSSLPEGRLLVRELTHRINNEFACLLNMVSLAAARTASIEARYTLAAVLDRLEGFAGVNRALQMPPAGHALDAGLYLEELCSSISQSKLPGTNIRLVFVENTLKLKAERCWLLGMIVYELINNAVRYAFDQAGGEIRVEFTQIDSLVECHVSDDGTASVLARRGQGLKIIEDLAASLQGRFEQRFGPNGSSSRVIFPA